MSMSSHSSESLDFDCVTHLSSEFIDMDVGKPQEEATGQRFSTLRR